MDMDDFYKVFEEALNAPTLMEVERDGKLLKREKCVNKEAFLYEYNDKKYIVIYKYKNLEVYFRDKECIKFCEWQWKFDFMSLNVA